MTIYLDLQCEIRKFEKRETKQLTINWSGSSFKVRARTEFQKAVANTINFFSCQVLKMMVGNNLKDTQLQQIVDKTILFADKDEDGKISFEEFCNIVGNTDIHKKMVVDV